VDRWEYTVINKRV